MAKCEQVSTDIVYKITVSQTELDKLSALLACVNDAELNSLYDAVCPQSATEYDVHKDLDADDIFDEDLLPIECLMIRKGR